MSGGETPDTTMPYNIVVTGSREWTDKACIRSVLRTAHAKLVPPGTAVTLHHGGCRGADRLAGDAAKAMNGWTVTPWAAQWKKHRKKAGPIRNTAMLKGAHPNLVIAFTPNLEASRGTRNAWKKAQAMAKACPDGALRLWHVTGAKA